MRGSSRMARLYGKNHGAAERSDRDVRDSRPTTTRLQLRLWFSLLCLLALTACASVPTGEPSTPSKEASVPSASPVQTGGAADPLEGFNRAIYAFNDGFDKYLLAPVARGYRWVLPRVVRDRFSSFFSILREPMNALNNLLQGKPYEALTDTARLLANSTIGIAGLWDVATPLGLPKHDEDFGQTLAVWGVGDGPYLVLPFLGPSNFRDGPAKIVNWFTLPQTYLEDSSLTWTLFGMEFVDTRAQLLDATDILEQAAGEDPYAFVREAYRQRRRSLIYDGHPPAERPDPLLFEDDAPARAPGSKGVPTR